MNNANSAHFSPGPSRGAPGQERDDVISDLQLALTAADFAERYDFFVRRPVSDRGDKADPPPVTEADKAAETVVRQLMPGSTPAMPYSSGEGIGVPAAKGTALADRPDRRYVNFVRGIPVWATCRPRGGRVMDVGVAGSGVGAAVVGPAGRGCVFRCSRQNGERIRVSQNLRAVEATISCGRRWRFKDPERVAGLTAM